MEKEKKVENLYAKYIDPENYSQIVEDIKNAENHNQVVDIINKTFPGWILGWPERYSKDYPHFQNNWEFVCNKSGCKPLRVVIVDYIIFKNPNYKLLHMFSELLTLFGHSVRRKEEFIGCKICGNAIPSQQVYNQLVERKVTSIPRCWMIKCRTC